MLRQTAIYAAVLLLSAAGLTGASSSRVAAEESYGKLPMQFEPNRGQADPQTRFLVRGRGYALYLTDTGAVMAARNGEKTSLVRMQLRGANPRAEAEALDALPGVANYFIGNDPKQWRRDVPTSRRVKYHDVWPGIDLVYYGNQKELEYDFVVRPGAQPDQIRFAFDGMEKLWIADNGDLLMRTAGGEVRHRQPVIYQETATGRRQVHGRYLLRGHEVAFAVAGYDRKAALVIDPVMLYSTLLGGSSTDYLNAIAVDGAGNAYVTGNTISTDFPTLNPVAAANAGSYDVIVAKFNPTGTALVYSTYVGGSGSDTGRGIAVDSGGNVYVTGNSYSTNFPMVNAAQSTSAGGNEVFAFKLNPSGNTLLYSTYFGGTGDEAGYGIAIDGPGNAYIAGDTTSANLPVTTGAASVAYGGSTDAFVLKLNASGAESYATYLGGSGTDSARAIVVDAAGNAFATGWTNSSAFPTTPGAYSRTKGASNDIFVTKVNPTGAAWVFSTFVGGNGSDAGYAIALDTSGVYAGGSTYSTDFPGTAGAAQSALAGTGDAVAFKLDPTGANLLWATYLGGNRSDQINGISVDAAGNVYAAGYTYASGFPTVNALQTAPIGVGDSIYRSGDAGTTWLPSVLPASTNPTVIRVSPTSTSTLFLLDCLTVYSSTDSGATWTSLGAASGSCATDMTIDPANASVIYLATPAGVQKSTNGGSTWASASSGLTSGAVINLAVDAGSSLIVYASTSSGLYKSVDAGGTWNLVSTLPGTSLRRVMTHPTIASLVFVSLTTNPILYRSPDAGATWANISNSASNLFGITFSAANPNAGYVFGTGGYIGKTTDAGLTVTNMTNLPSGSVDSLVADPNVATTAYVADSAGAVYKTTDSATTWNAVTGTMFMLSTPRSLVVAPTNPTTLYALATLNPSSIAAKISADGHSILYSTYLSSGSGSSANGVAVGSTGTAYVAGWANTGFPSTAGAYQPAGNGGNDGFVTQISDATPACAVAVAPAGKTFSYSGTSYSALSATAASGCAWTASTTTSWIHLISGIAGAPLSGTGAGMVYYSVDASTSLTARTGNITVGGQTFTITQNGVPSLSIVKAHSGSFTQGQLGALYTLTVSNAASPASASSGTVTVTENAPLGLTPISMTGTGWTCSTATTCTRSDTLNPGASYPAITVTVNVAANAAALVTNQAYAYGGGSSGNVYAYDPTAVTAAAPQYLISTIAGGIAPPTGGATSVPIGMPYRIVAGPAGSVYFADNRWHCVFKVDSAGVLTRVAGTCRPGFSGDGGPAVNAQLNTPQGLAVDSTGNLYISDSANYRIRKVGLDGSISTVAGTGSCCYSGDGGAAISALVGSPQGLAFDGAGNLYLAGNSRIRKITPAGIISTVAGTGTSGFSGDGGLATAAMLNNPLDLALDTNGNFYIVDAGNQRIRVISSGGTINTFAGNGTAGFSGDNGPATSAMLNRPQGVAVDSSGNVYVADENNNRIREIAPGGTIVTFAGGSQGFSGDNGPATSSNLFLPYDVATDSSGNLYIADTFNYRIRKVTAGTIATIAGNGANFSADGGFASLSMMTYPQYGATDAAGNFYFADYYGNRVRRIAPDGTIVTVAGNGTSGLSVDGGSATSTGVPYPVGVAVDSSGNLYISHQYFVRMVTPGGIISTVAGTGNFGYSGDGGPATSAQISSPQGLATDSAGNLYISDSSNQRVRKVTTANGVISTVAGTGIAGYSGDGGQATSAQLSSPYGLALDAAGNLYISDTYNDRVRKLAANGIITTVAGNGSSGSSGDDGPATSAQLVSPYGLAVDGAGNLLIADYSAHTIRKVLTNGNITTVAGTGIAGYSGDGGSAVLAQIDAPYGVSVDSLGRIYFTDYGASAVRLLTPAGTLAVLTVTKTHTGNFTFGQNGATHTVTVSNAAAAGPTSGTVTVTDVIPTALTLVSMSGTGWSCNANVCTRSDALAGGSSYPPITVTVNVAANAPSQVTNQVTVSGGGALGGGASDLAIVTPAPLRFVPMTPCRIVDTRNATGPFGGPIIAGGTSRDFTVPSSACSIPATAQAYSLNVAVVPATTLGYLTLYPAGQTRPLASTLNSLDGRIKSNAAIVPAGTNGAVSVFASDSTQVILDINGYFVPATDPTGLAFYPITPCRIGDTRTATAPLGGPALVGGQNRTLPILSSTCNLPATAQAYSLNFAAVPGGSSLGYLTAWPTGQARPVAASLNALTGAVTANAAIVPAGTNGSIDVFASNNTNLVIDINGYFAPMGTGGLSLYGVTPCRVLDTRQPSGSAPITSLDVAVSASACGIPANAQADVMSVTVVPQGSPAYLGYLTLWPQGQTRPVVSTLNALDGAITSNMAIVPTTNGSISAFASNPTHLIIDISGYFAQ